MLTKREKFNMKKYTDTKIIVEIRRNDTGEVYYREF
jgi:hypothetical protein